MAAHKYWSAALLTSTTPDTLELGEFQLYAAGARVDAAATLTSNVAPTSGTLAQLKDGVSTSGPYWSTGGASVILNWAFPSAVDVDSVKLGCRTTVSRFPASGTLLGSDAAIPAGFVTVRGFGYIKFVSGTLLAVVPLGGPAIAPRPISTNFDYSSLGGRGLITDTVKTKATPTNLPTFCKVRLVRDIDGKVIRETWTNPITGVYRFDDFDPTFTYTVMAIHPTGGYRAVIADRLTPGLMP